MSATPSDAAPHHLGGADLEAAGSLAAPLRGGLLGDVIGIHLGQDAIDRMDASGDQDDAMRHVAEVGVMTAKVKLAIGIASAVVALIILLIIYSQFHKAEQQQQQQQQFPGGLGVTRTVRVIGSNRAGIAPVRTAAGALVVTFR